MPRITRTLAIHGLAICGVIFGQVIVSSIVGRVTDPSGATVPGAQVTVTNSETGISVKTVTSSEGTYAVPGLLAGTYDVAIDKPGMQIYQTKGMSLLSSQTARVDAAL